MSRPKQGTEICKTQQPNSEGRTDKETKTNEASKCEMKALNVFIHESDKNCDFNYSKKVSMSENIIHRDKSKKEFTTVSLYFSFQVDKDISINNYKYTVTTA